MDLGGVRDLVLDPRRHGTPEERRAYLAALATRHDEVRAALGWLGEHRAWLDRSPTWVDDQLELTATVARQVGTVRGEYAEARDWGDRVLALGAAGSLVRRADLMLHLSELHRVTGRSERCAELVAGAAELLAVPELSNDDLDALAPVGCHALFCLGALAYRDGRPQEATPLLTHAQAHGGDSWPHLWSLVTYALQLTDRDEDHQALAVQEAAGAMAERLGDHVALVGVRNNRACTLRRLGRHREAYEEFALLLPVVLAEDVPDLLLTATEDFACVLFDMGRDRDGALVVGAALAERTQSGLPRMGYQEAAVRPSIGAGRRRLGVLWGPLVERGAELGVPAAVTTVLRPPE